MKESTPEKQTNIGVLLRIDLETVLPAQQIPFCFCLLILLFAINLTKTSRMKMRMCIFEGNIGRQPQAQRTQTNFALAFLPITPWPPLYSRPQGRF